MPGLTVLRWFGSTKPPVHINKQSRGTRSSTVCTAVSGFGNGSAASSPEDPPEETDVSPSGTLNQLQTAAWDLRRLVGLVAVPSLQLASRLLCRRWEPLQDQVQQHLASMEGIKDACKALHVDSLQDLQDVLGSLLLSESVYKVLEMDGYKALMAVNNLKAHFPAHLVNLRRVQWAMPHAEHSYLLADSPDALYVAFMGTKRPRDLRCNVDVWQDQVLFKAAASEDCEQQGELPAAHRGFSSRAKSIPIEALYQQARSQGKRLVLCGHSLGGAVAQLCTIRLLQQLPSSALATVTCIGFATPPVGNRALADMVKQNGWGSCFKNYLLPEDPIPRLLSSKRPASASTVPAEEEQPVLHTSSLSSTSALASVSLRNAAFAKSSLFRSASPGSRSSVDEEQIQQLSETSTSSLPAPTHIVNTASSINTPLTSTSSAAASATQRNVEVDEGSSAGHAANNISPAEGLGIFRRKFAKRALNVAALRSLGSEQTSAAAPEHHGVSVGEQHTSRQKRGGSTREGECEAGSDCGFGVGEDCAVDAVASATATHEHPSEEREEGIAEARRMQWMPQPPFRVMAQSARVAARFVTFPLAAAASVPMRVAPQFYEVGKTLYVHQDGISSSSPSPDQRQGGILPLSRKRKASAAELAERISFYTSADASARSSPAQPRAPASHALDGSADDSDEAETELSAAATAVAESRVDNDLAPTQLPPRTFFPMHRMVSYRQRLLGICQESIKGRVWLPALPHFPNVPHPDDVTATMLLAPGLFPLKAEARALAPQHHVAAEPNAALPATEGGGLGFARFIKPFAAVASLDAVEDTDTVPSMGGHSSSDSQKGVEGRSKQPDQQGRRRRRWGFLRFFLRQRSDEQSAPVELEVRVEGKGLNTVTKAWVELGGLQPKPLGGGMSEGSLPAEITWKPSTAAPGAVLRHPFAAVTPVGSFFSWLAVTLGWVRLLRRLQPAGQNDYLVARVKVPADVAMQAHMAASNPIQAAVNDAHLPGVRVGPKLTMHLQSDFARTSIPLDIRVAADMTMQLGWARIFLNSWQEEGVAK